MGFSFLITLEKTYQYFLHFFIQITFSKNIYTSMTIWGQKAYDIVSLIAADHDHVFQFF